jgi:hypothetical protein
LFLRLMNAGLHEMVVHRPPRLVGIARANRLVNSAVRLSTGGPSAM